MSDLNMGTSDSRTAKIWHKKLNMDVYKDSFFTSKFISKSGDGIIQEFEDLTKAKGDKITIGIVARGDDGYLPSGTKVDGNEEDLITFNDDVTVDEKNFGIANSSMISEQRAFYDMPDTMYNSLTQRAAEKMDKEYFTALDTTNTICLYKTAGTLTATSTIATAVNAVTAADKISPETLTDIKPMLVTGFNRRVYPVKPVRVDGQYFWVVLVHSDALSDWENDTTIQQARREALNRGKDNPIFTGAWAVWNQFIIFAHENIGIGSNTSSIPYAKCHILGQGALASAWAKRPTVEAKKPAYTSQEKGWGYFSIFGVIKPQYNAYDFGSVNLVVARRALSNITIS
jgi:N4-gp56 family major capsid protein